MAGTQTQENTSRASGYHLIRILLASYFVMVSIGFISGTNATPLASLFMSAENAELVGSAAPFILGFLVLSGIWMRPAAYMLAAIIVGSSLILHFGTTAVLALENFWRDLTLVGILLVSCTKAPSHNRGSLLGLTSSSVKTDQQLVVAPRRVAIARPSNVTRLPIAPKHPPVFRRVDNIFLDELGDSIAS